MKGVSHAIGTKLSSKRVRGLLLCISSASWSNNISESGNGVLSYKFEASNDVTLHELTEVVEEGLAFMFLIKLIADNRSLKLCHLQF